MNIRIPHGPAGWQMCMGLYAGCIGLSLTVSPNAFGDAPVWSVMARWIGNPLILAVVMFAYAAATLVCLTWGVTYKRASLALIGVPLWGFVGLAQLLGAGEAGFFSAAGAFEIGAAFGCAVATVQWGRDG